MAHKGRNILYGSLVWLIPTAITWGLAWLSRPAFFIFSSWSGVVAAAIAAFFLVKYFAGITRDHVKEGIVVGVTWLVIGAVLTPPLAVPYQSFLFHRFGWPSSDMVAPGELYIRHLLSTVRWDLIIPVMSIGFGFALRRQRT